MVKRFYWFTLYMNGVDSIRNRSSDGHHFQPRFQILTFFYEQKNELLLTMQICIVDKFTLYIVYSKKY